MRCTSLVPGIALFLAAAAPRAQADVLTPAQILRVTFTVNPNWVGSSPDVLSLNFGIVNVLTPFTSRTAALYDGAALLGAHTNTLFGGHTGPLSLNPSNTFAEAGSPYTFLTPATVDFTTIQNGTIVGRIDFTIQTGAIDIPLNQVNISGMRANGPSSGTLVNPQPTTTSVTIVDPTTFTTYCFGDGSGNTCPCGNSGGAGEGCANSTGSGATLAASGSNSALADDLVFDAANLLPSQPALLFCGNNAVAGGAGVAFGDGLRCAGGGVRRLGVRFPSGLGQASWGPGLGAAGGWTAGDVRYFQAWYRNPSGSPCGTNFNLSHGVEVVFQ